MIIVFIVMVLNRTGQNLIENYTYQATHRWCKRLTRTCYAVKCSFNQKPATIIFWYGCSTFYPFCALPSQQSVLGHHRLTSETPFEWRFAGGPIVARFQMFTW